MPKNPFANSNRIKNVPFYEETTSRCVYTPKTVIKKDERNINRPQTSIIFPPKNNICDDICSISQVIFVTFTILADFCSNSSSNS